MQLGALLAVLPAAEQRGAASTVIAGLSHDSRCVQAGDLFVCLRGHTFDGHDYAAQAAARGAVALVVESWLPLNLPQVRVPDSRRALLAIARAFYDDPAARLGLIGITGTNGKTTTAYLVHSILTAAGGTEPWRGPGPDRPPVAMLGTVANIVGDRVTPAAMTTSEADDTTRLWWSALAAGCRWLVMEVSSHALALNRVDPGQFDAAVITNVTRDHFEFHQSFTGYLDSKARLLTGLTPEPKGNRTKAAVVNLDDAGARQLLTRSAVPPVTFGFSPGADVRARAGRESNGRTTFELVLPGVVPFPVQLQLPGRFNVANALAAAAVAWCLGIPPLYICRGLEQLTGVPGRTERIDAGQDFAVLVDFAHNPGALENILTLRPPRPDGRVILVFGAEGGKDQGKRPEMGRAARAADYAIITSDNMKEEDPLAVAQMLAEPLRGHPHEIILDRRAAIERAVDLAGTGDLVIIAGKGHERTWTFGDKVMPFDDREVVRHVIQERLKAGR